MHFEHTVAFARTTFGWGLDRHGHFLSPIASSHVIMCGWDGFCIS
jgi:hypothetical protein